MACPTQAEQAAHRHMIHGTFYPQRKMHFLTIQPFDCKILGMDLNLSLNCFEQHLQRLVTLFDAGTCDRF